MAKTLSPVQVQAGGPSSSELDTQPSPASSSTASATSSLRSADAAEGEVVRSASVGSVTDPEHAAALLKTKVSMLHKLVHDAGHFASLALSDVEALLADIKFLTGLIRSKV